MSTLGRLTRIATHDWRNPRWLVTNLRMQLRRRAGSKKAFAVDLDPRLIGTTEEVFASLLSLGRDDFAEASANTFRVTARGTSFSEWNGSDDLISVLSVAVQAMKPAMIVETGVANGYSSAAMLAALAHNGFGELHSIDLPALGVPKESIGRVVPGELRSRWHLHLGPSDALLPQVRNRLGAIDIFLHDADHTYESQMTEYLTAWPFIRSGGLLISDDVNNPAFTDFAQAQGCEARLISQEKPGFIGMARKPQPARRATIDARR